MAKKSTKKTHVTKTKPSNSLAAALSPRWVKLGYVGVYLVFVTLFVVGLTIHISALNASARRLSETNFRDSKTYQLFSALSQNVTKLEIESAQAKISTVDTSELEQELSLIQTEIARNHHRQAQIDIGRLQRRVNAATAQLKAATTVPAATENTTINVPILLYHYLPDNLDQQLTALSQKGYTTITPSQLAAGLHRTASLPAKPVIITFDDGYKNQLDAFKLLQKHNMLATYYIIDGGKNSRWCIGASRRYDPSQPAGGCGDSYMNWDDIRMLDRSGLVTIGVHTVDHEELAVKSLDEQRFQILEGKRQLEAQLGHSVTDFAYPYGSFTAETVDLVRQAGFTTAVSTIPGTTQSTDNIYTLRRVRDALALP